MLENLEIPHRKISGYNNVETLNFIEEILQGSTEVIGANVFNRNYKYNVRTYITIALTHIFMFSYIFIIFADVPLIQKLEGVPPILICYQGCHKFYTFILNSNYFYKLFSQIHGLHIRYVNERAIEPKLKKLLAQCIFILELNLICYIVVVLAYIAFPLIMWFVNNELTTIFPIQLPFIDWHQPLGYTINTIYQMVLLVLGIVGMLTADLAFMYTVFQSIAYFEIFNYRLDRLNKLMDSNPGNIRIIEATLLESFAAHQDYIEYNKQMNKYFAQLCLMQLVTSEIILIFSVLLTLWNKWIIGFFMTVAALIQITEYCILGIIIKFQNNKALTIIYNMKWYKLPLRLQKLVILMTLRT